MLVKLGPTSRFIQVTPDYSNAVLTAVLPYFSDVAKKLDLPVPQPITPADIAKVRILPFRDMAASILLKDGWVFNFILGYVQSFTSPHSYFVLQDPEKIPNFYGEVKMSEAEAVQLAREILVRLNIPVEDVFAEREPRVTPPEKIETNTVARYRIEWLDPRSGNHAVDVEINAETRQVERVQLLAKSLERPAPQIGVTPPTGHGMFDSHIPGGRINPEYASRLIPIMFKAVDDYAQKLSLPILPPLTTNNVARVEIEDNGGWPHCEITLTNGWRFIYRHTMVNGYYAPDVFVSNDNRPFHVREFEGKWNLTTNQAIELVKKTLAKLNYPTNNIHMDFAPNIIYAAGDFKKIIPRCFFEWNYENAAYDDLQSKVEAEVNADNGKLESLYYDDKAYWGSRPPIDAPISIK
jgi:hypothetical protein